jgi:hypothetical protein
MKEFEFIFDGKPEANGEMTTGIKLLRGDAVDVGRCLGVYADGAMKQKKEPHAAMIVINAYREFRKRNPELTRKIENEIASRDGGLYMPNDF